MRHKAKLAGKNLPDCYLKPFNEIQLFPERLDQPSKVKKPSTIFVGSMSDPDNWSYNQMILILNQAYNNPQHTFMFLTKNINAYNDIAWPKNTMQGVTMDCTQKGGTQAIGICERMQYLPRPFLSIEPLLGTLLITLKDSRFEKVIVGAMTGKDAIKPKPEWIGSIRRNVPEEKIFWKNNIKRYL